MGKNIIRLLRADEIECRIGTINEKGLSLLLYKDARVDMKILDEVYGSLNWQRKHEMIGGNLFCTISIWDAEKQQWISKMDVGTKSRTEQEKGEASDSFKRACFSVGIGRELYTAPFIWVSIDKIDICKKGDRYVSYDKFKVRDISYDENHEIEKLSIENQKGKIVYHLEKGEKNNKNNHLEKINQELQRTGVALDEVLKRYGVSSIEEMDENTYKKAMNSLKRTKPKVA